jgi:hypothetical protein
MRFSDLTEAAADPLPKKFWLVIDIPVGIYGHQETKQARLADIARGELTGVLGISDSKQIVTGWFMMCRNAVVLMDPEQVAERNDIEKIHYDDPDWLCRNNCAPLYRIWDKKTNKWGHDGMMMNFAQYVIELMGSIDQNCAHMMSYNGFATKFAKEWQEHQTDINSASDAAHWFEEHFAILLKQTGRYDPAEFKDIDWNAAVRKALLKVGTMYSDEAEWLVMNPSFHIPKGSTMLIGINMEAAKLYPEWKNSKGEFRWEMARYTLEAYEELMETIDKLRLADYYNITFVDGRKFERLRPEVMARRRKAK